MPGAAQARFFTRGIALMLGRRWPAARHGVAWPVDLIYPRGDAFCHIGGKKASIEGIDTNKAQLQPAKEGVAT